MQESPVRVVGDTNSPSVRGRLAFIMQGCLLLHSFCELNTLRLISGTDIRLCLFYFLLGSQWIDGTSVTSQMLWSKCRRMEGGQVSACGPTMHLPPGCFVTDEPKSGIYKVSMLTVLMSPKTTPGGLMWCCWGHLPSERPVTAQLLAKA